MAGPSAHGSSRMKKTTLPVALVQERNHGNAEANLAVIEQRVAEAAAQGAKLVLLQELHNGAYFCQHECVDEFDLAETIPGPSTERLGALARQHGVVLVSSLFEKRAAGLYHNTAVVFDADGSTAGKYRKMLFRTTLVLREVLLHAGRPCFDRQPRRPPGVPCALPVVPGAARLWLGRSDCCSTRRLVWIRTTTRPRSAPADSGSSPRAARRVQRLPCCPQPCRPRSFAGPLPHRLLGQQPRGWVPQASFIAGPMATPRSSPASSTSASASTFAALALPAARIDAYCDRCAAIADERIRPPPTSDP